MAAVVVVVIAMRMKRISVINLHLVQCATIERSLHVLTCMHIAPVHIHTSYTYFLCPICLCTSFFISSAQDGHDEDIFIVKNVVALSL